MKSGRKCPKIKNYTTRAEIKYTELERRSLPTVIEGKKKRKIAVKAERHKRN